jgi:hypothetical protein
MIHVHALVKRFFCIIRTLDEFGPVIVADFILSRGVEINVVDSIASCAGPASGDPAQQMLFVHAKFDRNRRWKAASFSGKLIQPFGLSQGSGEAIQDVSGRRVRLCEANRNHLVHQVVRYQLSLPHQVVGYHPQLCAVPTMLPEQIASGNLGNAEA